MISLPRYSNCLPTLCELKSNNGIFLLHCCRWCSHDDDVWFVMYTRSEPQQQSTAIQRAWDSGKEIKNWFLSSSWDVFNLSKIVLYFSRSISFEIFWPFWQKSFYGDFFKLMPCCYEFIIELIYLLCSPLCTYVCMDTWKRQKSEKAAEKAPQIRAKQATTAIM